MDEETTAHYTHIPANVNNRKTEKEQLLLSSPLKPSSSDISTSPFVYRLYSTKVDRLVWCVMLIAVVPFKVIICLSLLTLAWLPARLSVVGLPLQPNKPLSKWRVILKDVATFFANCVAYAGGLLTRKVKGVRASNGEASLLVVAPHTSFLDVMVGVMCGMPGVVSLLENASLPLLGALFRANQTIFLDKKDPQSRMKTTQAIRTRAESKGAWSQLLIYPEGMIGNGSALLPFKLGAFQPGVPIQPVTVKYPNRLDVTTWLDSGPTLGSMISLFICTPLTRMEVEFHPVYTPTEEEKKNPELFAENVRTLMSGYLNIPTTTEGSKDIRELVKRTKPNMGVYNLWKTIITKGCIEMPAKEHFS